MLIRGALRTQYSTASLVKTSLNMWLKILHFAARAPRPDAVFDLIYDKAMRLFS